MPTAVKNAVTPSKMTSTRLTPHYCPVKKLRFLTENSHLSHSLAFVWPVRELTLFAFKVFLKRRSCFKNIFE